MTVSEMRQLAQTGASLTIEVERGRYTMAELLAIAQGMARDAILTIRMDRDSGLSPAECLQLAKTRPGKITFWFY